MKSLYTENYKTLINAIEEDRNKWKDVLCSWIGKINIGKVFVVPKVLYRCLVILIKIPMTEIFFTEIDETTLKFV